MGWENGQSNCSSSLTMPRSNAPRSATRRNLPAGASNSCSQTDVDAILAGLAGAEWAARYPDLKSIQSDSPCVPVFNMISSNWFDSSVAQIVDASLEDLASWHITLAGNWNTSAAEKTRV